MLRRIESPRVGTEAELGDDLLRDSFLTVDGKVPGHERVVDLDVAELCDQRNELRLELGEDLAHLCSRRVRLEVVEQDVVRLLDAVEAVDVAAAQLHGPFHDGQEELEVRLGFCLDPDRTRLCRGARHLRAQLRRDARRFLVLTPGDPDERRVVGVGLERVLEWTKLVEQATRLVIDQELV